MSKTFRRLIFSLLILLLISGESSAVTKYEFLNNMLLVRGIDWSESPEAPYNDAAGFLLRTGYVTDNVGKLDAELTRREALRITRRASRTRRASMNLNGAALSLQLT